MSGARVRSVLPVSLTFPKTNFLELALKLCDCVSSRSPTFSGFVRQVIFLWTEVVEVEGPAGCRQRVVLKRLAWMLTVALVFSELFYNSMSTGSGSWPISFLLDKEVGGTRECHKRRLMVLSDEKIRIIISSTSSCSIYDFFFLFTSLQSKDFKTFIRSFIQFIIYFVNGIWSPS